MIRRKLPPMLFLHGKNDPITPLAPVISFRRWMKWKGNCIEVIDYEGAEHRFFNFNFSHRHHDLTLQAIEKFLSENKLMPDYERHDY
jgi:acetyl esterase/lipase